MNKQEYLESIRSRISAMPADDVNRFMDYYSEMIDDRVEDGLSEEEAVADMGSPDAAVEQILEDMPLTKLVKEKIKPKHELKAWEVVLIVLGSPVWIPLLITAAVLLLTLWIVAFALLISFYAVVLSFVAAGIGGLICTIPLFIANSPPPSSSTMTAGIVLTAPRTASHTNRLIGSLFCLFLLTTNNNSNTEGNIASLNANALILYSP